MNLFKVFLHKLECEEQISKREIRVSDVESLLKKEVSKATSLTDYCRKNKVNKGTLYYMLNGRRAIYLDLINLDELDNKQAKIILSGCNVAVKIPTELTLELAYLIGVLRDGSIVLESNDEYTCVFYSKYREALRIVKDYLKNVFDLEREIENNKENLFMVRIRSKTLYMFFKLLFEVPRNQKDWGTPKLIIGSSDLIKRSYIRGFWDAEGGCPHLETKRKLIKKNLEVKFSQKNKESLGFIKDYLNSVGVRTGNVYWNKDTYVLKITQTYIPKFKDLIGSSHPVKAERLSKLAELFVR